MVEALRSAKADGFVFDGELTIPLEDTLSFGALQDRLHPAESRIRKPSAETPALLILFDCLGTARTGSLLHAPLTQRRLELQRITAVLGSAHRTCLSPLTHDLAEATRWLDDSRAALDGVVAKRTDGLYAPGLRGMLKVKRLRTADCVVGGFRPARAASEMDEITGLSRSLVFSPR